MALAVTVIAYVPAGVPGLPPPPELPPAHEVMASPAQSKSANVRTGTARSRWSCRKKNKLRSTAVSNNPSSIGVTRLLVSRGPRFANSGRKPFDGAVVVTVTVALTGDAHSRRGVGETEQAAPEGAPLH